VKLAGPASPTGYEVVAREGGRPVVAGDDVAEAERSRQRTPRERGKCNSFSWGGEGPWAHGPGKPGGRRLCYFDGNDAVIVWTRERLGQANHRETGTSSGSPAREAAIMRG
jgi:hypothetical protein